MVTTMKENAAQELLAKEIVDVAVVLKEHIILHGIRDVANAFAPLIGLLYCLNIDNPKGLKYTFKLMQKVFMCIGSGNCSAITNVYTIKLHYTESHTTNTALCAYIHITWCV